MTSGHHHMRAFTNPLFKLKICQLYLWRYAREEKSTRRIREKESVNFVATRWSCVSIRTQTTDVSRRNYWETEKEPKRSCFAWQRQKIVKLSAPFQTAFGFFSRWTLSALSSFNLSSNNGNGVPLCVGDSLSTTTASETERSTATETDWHNFCYEVCTAQ